MFNFKITREKKRKRKRKKNKKQHPALLPPCIHCGIL
jgi:hypothetical protein